MNNLILCDIQFRFWGNMRLGYFRIWVEYLDFAIMRQPPALCKCCVPRGNAIRVLNMMMVIMVILIKVSHKVGECESYLDDIATTHCAMLLKLFSINICVFFSNCFKPISARFFSILLKPISAHCLHLV